LLFLFRFFGASSFPPHFPRDSFIHFLKRILDHPSSLPPSSSLTPADSISPSLSSSLSSPLSSPNYCTVGSYDSLRNLFSSSTEISLDLFDVFRLKNDYPEVKWVYKLFQ
jgi:hypothetical protein